MKLAVSAAAMLAMASPAWSAPPGPPSEADTVVVTAPKPVVVVATTCPEPDPSRYHATEPPRVVDSYPAPGAVVAPGYSLVRVSFDAPMSCYSEVMVDGPGDPCQPTGAWDLPARRSWKMLCRLEPGTDYVVKFRKIDGAGFVGLSGRTAQPFELAFSTSGAPPTASPEAAARLDPGAAGSGVSYGYVTCTDRQTAARRDCQRGAYTAPPP